MENINLNSLNTLARVDQNLSHHYLHFKRYSNDDSRLMFLLLVYFSHNRENNLFGYGTLDPVKFCDFYGLPKNHTIWTKHQNPRQLQKYSLEELQATNTDVWDTVLENALYCLFSDVYEFKDRDKQFLHKEAKRKTTLKKISSVQILKSIELKEIKVGRTNKKVYGYVLSQEFLENLSFLFFKVNINSLAHTFQKKMEGLYFKLCALRDYMKNNGIVSTDDITFDKLKEVLEIESDNPRYIKQKINDALKRIEETELKDVFDYKWFQLPGQRFEYGFKIIYKLPLDEQKITYENKLSWDDSHKIYLRNHLIDNYKERNPEYSDDPDDLKHEYTQWLKNNNQDRDIKFSSYVTAYKKFNPHLKESEILHIAEVFIKNLPNNYRDFV